MLTKIMTATLVGVEGQPVTVETDWENLQAQAARPWDEWEAKREKIREILGPCEYAYWMIGYRKTAEELMQTVREMCKQRTADGLRPESDYITRCVFYYCEYREKMPEMIAEYNRLTREMKENVQ